VRRRRVGMFRRYLTQAAPHFTSRELHAAVWRRVERAQKSSNFANQRSTRCCSSATACASAGVVICASSQVAGATVTVTAP